MRSPLKGALIATAVAGLFLANGALAQKAEGEKAEAKVKCEGVNECKGKGKCAGAGHECAGENGCKGKGWIELSEADCKGQGGTIKK